MWGFVVAAPLWCSVKKYFEITTLSSQEDSQPFLRKIPLQSVPFAIPLSQNKTPTHPTGVMDR
jgi:hypothetical protein